MATFWEIAARSVSNCSHCILSICNIYLFPALVLRAGFAFWLHQFLFIAFLLLLLAEFLWLCSVAAAKSLPAHPFNALIFPILRGCVQSFVIFLSLNSIPSRYFIEGLNGLTFASRCINILTFHSVDLY